MAWLLLLLAGLFEACWAIGLKLSGGFSKPIPSLFVAASMVSSLVLLAFAVRSLPIGTAYAIWTGIGAFGAAVGGIILFNEPITMPRLLFLALLIVSIIGLKITTGNS